MSKLSDVVKYDVVKKTVYDKLVAKVNNIYTNDYVLKTKYNTDNTELEKKIPNVTDFVKKVKLTELENKIPDISCLVTKTPLTAVENKIPDVSNLVKKKTITQKLLKLKINLIIIIMTNTATSECNKLAADVFNAGLAQANLMTKADFDAKLSSLNKNITSNKTKHLVVENELNKLKTFDSSYFIGKGHFEEDGTQNYLVFRPLNKYFKLITNTLSILSWQSKGLSTENIGPPTTSLSPSINYAGNKTRVKFTGSCLK